MSLFELQHETVLFIVDLQNETNNLSSNIFNVIMGRHEPTYSMKYEFEKPMRFWGMNVYF